MPDEFSKTTEKQFGHRGESTFYEEEQTTDVESLEKRVREKSIPVCTCGKSITTEAGDPYRCVNCNQLACRSCIIAWSRYHYCPLCIRRAYNLDKHTYLSLVFLDRGFMAPDELVQVTTDSAGTVIDVEIDAAAGTMLEHDYLTDSGGLSAEGKEALHLGHQVFGRDDDVRAVLDQIRLHEVVSR